MNVPFSTSLPQERLNPVAAFGYPNLVPLSIKEQLRKLRAFGFPICDTRFAENLEKRGLCVPDYVECLAVVPKSRKIARDRRSAIEFTFRALFGISIDPDDCLLTPQTLQMLDAISNEQFGDVMVFGCNMGRSLKNISPAAADMILQGSETEFAIDTLSGAFIVALYPERFSPNCLRMDFAGSMTADGEIHYCRERQTRNPNSNFPGRAAKLNTRLANIPLPNHGVAKGFRLKL